MVSVGPSNGSSEVLRSFNLTEQTIAVEGLYPFMLKDVSPEYNRAELPVVALVH